MPVIDHIVIASADLDDGAAAFEASTGCALGPGGKHAMMGTYNRLCQSGNGTYCELVAVDPEAAAPPRPRWFGLSDPDVLAKIAVRPRAVAFIVGAEDLDRTIAASPVPLGPALSMNRGDLTWRVTVPDDGMPVEGGLVPGFIDWGGKPNPSAKLVDAGIELRKIVASHPNPAALRDIYRALEIDGLIEIVEGEVGLSFVLGTPGGEVVFD